ncbi:MAG: DNA gyrase inhibitor YacG [Pseudomonadota bacterium]
MNALKPPGPPCPVCETRLSEKTYRPFCSRRCADVDLSRWLKGGYAIPGGPGENSDETPPSGDGA